MALPEQRNGNVAVPRALEIKYRVAEIAMGLFLEQGYENVTVEAVAEASAVSRRTVFRHFAGKDELPFPDHAERIRLLEAQLTMPDEGGDPIDVVIAATQTTMHDFMSRPELVLRRYRLTRLVPQLRERELIEHERYVIRTRAFLRRHLPADAAPYMAPAIAALIDSVHRSTLGDWTRSDGGIDAVGRMQEGMEWARRVLASADGARLPQMLVAVVPDNFATREAMVALRRAADEV